VQCIEDSSSVKQALHRVPVKENVEVDQMSPGEITVWRDVELIEDICLKAMDREGMDCLMC